MSRSIPIAPITLPSVSRSAEALSVVGMISPEALRGLRRALRVAPRSITSRSAARNSRVSSGLMKRESDCSNDFAIGVAQRRGVQARRDDLPRSAARIEACIADDAALDHLAQRSSKLAGLFGTDETGEGLFQHLVGSK